VLVGFESHAIGVECGGVGMRVALLVLALAAVAFLLRVLFALVREGIRVSPGIAKVYFARFHPSQGRKDLIVMIPGGSAAPIFAQGRPTDRPLIAD